MTNNHPAATRRWRIAGLASLAALVLAACGTGVHSNRSPSGLGLGAATPGQLQHCARLATLFVHPNTRIDSAIDVAAGELQLSGQAEPAHCLVRGRVHERKGSDGRDYAIGFEMRLPQAWSGRFFYQGNGGLDGNVRPAQGALGGGPITGALMQGFAVISSDAGHSGAQTPYFGLEPQARLDYGYQAVGKLTPMAKALIATAYGRRPDRSYIGGCSNGGRHAMVAAARFGEQYDGYLVGAPGFRLPLSAAAQLRGAQLWTPLATPGSTVRHPLNPNASIPDIGSAFTPAERQAVASAILQRCDAIDGLSDGIVQDTQACQRVFDIDRDVPVCGGARNGQCLTQAQKRVVDEVFRGVRTQAGQPVYAPFPWDPGLAAANWAQWKFVNSLALDPLSVGTVFSTPPGRVNVQTDDIGQWLTRVQATDAIYSESGWSLMTPPWLDQPVRLAPLKARGAKMVLYHGVSDAIFSAEDTRRWVLRTNEALVATDGEFARYFPVPGMNHCSGGPATDQCDLLSALVKWVERGEAPQAIEASARGTANTGGVNPELPAGWSSTRTRPLCAAPTVARYKGSGDPERAENFICR